MNTFWEYFWPVAALGFVFGSILGTLGYRRKRRAFFIAGLALAIAGAALWHGPLGAAGRLSTIIESRARFVLVDWEMSQVQGRLHHDPLTRRLRLSGPADDFQRQELVRIMGTIPGVSSATWSNQDRGIPLIGEAFGVSLMGFLIGLLLAYLFELRRRYNAQWKW